VLSVDQDDLTQSYRFLAEPLVAQHLVALNYLRNQVLLILPTHLYYLQQVLHFADLLMDQQELEGYQVAMFAVMKKKLMVQEHQVLAALVQIDFEQDLVAKLLNYLATKLQLVQDLLHQFVVN